MLAITPATRNRLLAIAILSLCAVCVAFPRPWQGSARGAARAATRYPWGVLASAHGGLEQARGRLAALWHASDEVRRLREENRALREALGTLTRQLHEARVQADDLARHLQAFRDDYRRRTMRAVPARVLGADPSPWRHSLFVDRGSADGVRKGMAAAWGSSIVGTVAAVRRHAATVRLLTDSRHGVVVDVADRPGDRGPLRGTGDRDGVLELEWIHFQPPQAGDLVVTSGLDAIVPPGLLAGRVVEASPSRKPLFFRVRVRPLLDLDRLTEVLLVSYAADDVEALRQAEAEAAGRRR